MITGYNGNSRQNPTAFKLYGGTNTDNMTLLGEYSDITYSGRNAAVSFKETYLRYYKIVITDTYEHRYVAMSELQWQLKLMIILLILLMLIIMLRIIKALLKNLLKPSMAT